MNYKRKDEKVYSQFPKAGEVWLVNIPQTGDHRIYGIRPVIIVSSSGTNKNSPIIKIIPLSRYKNKEHKLNKSKLHMLIYADNYPWLEDDSIVLCEQETPCDKTWFIKKYGILNDDDLDSISLIKAKAEPTWFIRAIKLKAYEDDEIVYGVYQEELIGCAH